MILAYDFPPYISVGAQRPQSWFEHFKEYNIYPIIVTRKWDEIKGDQLDYIRPSIDNTESQTENDFGRIIQAPYTPHLGNKLLIKYGKSRFIIARKIISVLHETFQFILPIGNKYPIYQSAHNYLKSNQVDLLIATGDPFILFRYTEKLSRIFNIPWFADYRDPWSMAKTNKKKFFQKRFEMFFEKKNNQSCSRIITVSEIMTNYILENDKNKFDIIENGYNDKLINSLVLPSQENEYLTIALCGSIYKHHPIYKFLSVINDIVSESNFDKIRIEFFGNNMRQEINQFINKQYPQLKNFVTFHEKMHQKKLFIELSKKNILLLFNAYATTGTKIYEYMALNRKILFCFKSDSESKKLFHKYYPYSISSNTKMNLQEELIRNTNSGIVVTDSQHLKQVIKDLYKEFTENRFINCKSEGYEIFSRSNQCKKMASIITNSVSSKKNGFS